MSQSSIDFWFSIGSTYTYLTVMRLKALEEREGVRFNWRPFYLAKIFNEANYHPFSGKTLKTNYMWRDLERRATKHGIPINVPAPYPLPRTAFANRLAFVGMQEGWGQDFVRASYQRWFQEGKPTGEEPNLSESLREVGQDLDRVISIAEDQSTDAALDAETISAKRLGVCGSPTFAVDSEIFWGDDHLEDALQWRKHGYLIGFHDAG